MMNMKNKVYLVLITLLVPFVSFAEDLKDINSVAKKATSIGNLVIELAISLAVIWIIVGVVRYFIMGKDGEDRSAAGMNILYGVIGLFVILSIWGFVYLFTNTFKFASNEKPSFDGIMLRDLNGNIPGKSSGGSGGFSNPPARQGFDTPKPIDPGAV